MTPFLFALTVVPLIGFYDGVFGPGTGSFFMLAFVTLAGFGVLKATAHTKFLNFGSNVGAFAVFLLLRRHAVEDRPDDGRLASSSARRSARASPCETAPGSSSRCWSSSAIALAVRLLADPATSAPDLAGALRRDPPTRCLPVLPSAGGQRHPHATGQRLGSEELGVGGRLTCGSQKGACRTGPQAGGGVAPHAHGQNQLHSPQGAPAMAA